jgi:hypothetical protein
MTAGRVMLNSSSPLLTVVQLDAVVFETIHPSHKPLFYPAATTTETKIDIVR